MKFETIILHFLIEQLEGTGSCILHGTDVRWPSLVALVAYHTLHRGALPCLLCVLSGPSTPEQCEVQITSGPFYASTIGDERTNTLGAISRNIKAQLDVEARSLHATKNTLVHEFSTLPISLPSDDTLPSFSRFRPRAATLPTSDVTTNRPLTSPRAGVPVPTSQEVDSHAEDLPILSGVAKKRPTFFSKVRAYLPRMLFSKRLGTGVKEIGYARIHILRGMVG